MQGRCWATSAWAWVGIFMAHRLPVISSEKGFGVSVPLYNVLICVCILGEETLFSWTSGEENWLIKIKITPQSKNPKAWKDSITLKKTRQTPVHQLLTRG